MIVHVVSHTHWDREWYHTAERFRQRLVPLIDELLDNADGSFLLDGQTVVLEDYLAVRPERASDLSAALRGGKLEAGPWFVLADELIPGGEGLVRNLLAGARTLRDLRAESPQVLYCPDSFGHPASLPDIAAGFGKALVVVWRGCRSERDAFHWRGRNERVLAYHLSRSGYELGANLPADAESAPERWAQISEQLSGRATTSVSLLLNGADHHARQRDLPRAIKELQWVAKPVTIERSSLSAFARELTRQAASSKIGEVSGELRDSYGYTWTLQGTLASRAHQKRRYARVERALVRDVEPWAALARLTRGTSRQHVARAAWRDVLLTQPHDSLCGCSADSVARAVDVRLESAEQQAAGLREDAVLELIGHDRDASRTRTDSPSVLVLRNPAARSRSGVAIVELATKIADAPVGPGSAPPQLPKNVATAAPAGIALQVLSEVTGFARTEAPRAYPDNDVVLRQRAAVWVSEIAALGVSTTPMSVGAAPVPLSAEPVVISGRRISNGKLTVSWTQAGQVTLTDVANRRSIRGLVSFEDREDRGDLYTPSPRKAKLVGKCASSRVLHHGPLRGTLGQTWKFKKGSERVELRLEISIDAGASFVHVDVVGDNRAMDHRLRILFACDVAGDTTTADAAFGPVDRVAPQINADAARMEMPLASAPLHRYVTRADGEHGVTLFSDGLAEYESVKRGIAVTLVRSVGELSRVDLPERPGHAGWPMPTPEAQCQGPFAASFAVLLHGARTDSTIDEIERTADDVLHPITGETVRSATALSPFAGVTLEGSGLAFSAVKESEAGEWVVLRCVNLLDHENAGRWRFGHAIREAKGSRLDEMPLEKLVVANNAVSFRAPPRGIVTILVR